MQAFQGETEIQKTVLLATSLGVITAAPRNFVRLQKFQDLPNTLYYPQRSGPDVQGNTQPTQVLTYHELPRLKGDRHLRDSGG